MAPLQQPRAAPEGSAGGAAGTVPPSPAGLAAWGAAQDVVSSPSSSHTRCWLALHFSSTSTPGLLGAALSPFPAQPTLTFGVAPTPAQHLALGPAEPCEVPVGTMKPSVTLQWGLTNQGVVLVTLVVQLSSWGAPARGVCPSEGASMPAWWLGSSWALQGEGWGCVQLTPCGLAGDPHHPWHSPAGEAALGVQHRPSLSPGGHREAQNCDQRGARGHRPGGTGNSKFHPGHGQGPSKKHWVRGGRQEGDNWGEQCPGTQQA